VKKKIVVETSKLIGCVEMSSYLLTALLSLLYGIEKSLDEISIITLAFCRLR
jgi:hypothetical protein